MERRLTINSEVRSNEPTKEDQVTKPEEQSEQDNKQPKKLTGYAIMWNTPSKDLGGFTEIVDPKALDGVDLSKVLMLSDHDYSKVLASVKAGTLILKPDEKGLYFEATLPDTTTANDVFSNVQAGNLDSCSFGFDLEDGSDEWSKDDQGNITRKINKIKDLFDVSVVAIPAYDGTIVAADEDENVQIDKRSYNEFLNKEGSKQMNQTIIDPTQTENTEMRSFENYIRSQGEQRDGLTTDSNGKALIPSEIVTPIFKSKVGNYDLAKYTTVKQVNTGSGTYPVASHNPAAFLATKEELAVMGDVDSGIVPVPFKVKTRAGKIYLSSELIEDSAVDFKKEVSDQLQYLVQNTNNHEIMELLKTLTPAEASDLDAVKTVANTKLDPALNPMVILNQDGFDYLDHLKNTQGDYLLTRNISAPFGRKLFGYDVVVVSNAVLPSDEGIPMFIGDLTETLATFLRTNVTANWTQFDSYSEGLSVVLRSDYEFINKDATQFIKLAQPAK